MKTGIGQILVVVDPTLEVSAAVAKAARLAQGAEASIELYLCDVPPALQAARLSSPELLKASAERIIAGHRAHLERLANPLRAAGLNVRSTVEFANPLPEAIVRRAAASGADLVVKDTHHHTLLSRTLLTHTDWHLIRDCPVPLLLVKASVWHDPPVLCAAVDPNHPDDVAGALDDAIVDAAVRLAHALGTRARLAHVFSSLNYLPLQVDLPGVPIGLDLEAVEALRQLHHAELAAVADRNGIGREDVHLIDGLVTDALPAFATREGIDIVAIGAVARGRLHDRFLGSTATRVLDRIASDLLIAKLATSVA